MQTLTKLSTDRQRALKRAKEVCDTHWRKVVAVAETVGYYDDPHIFCELSPYRFCAAVIREDTNVTLWQNGRIDCEEDDIPLPLLVAFAAYLQATAHIRGIFEGEW